MALNLVGPAVTIEPKITSELPNGIVLVPLSFKTALALASTGAFVAAVSIVSLAVFLTGWAAVTLPLVGLFFLGLNGLQLTPHHFKPVRRFTDQLDPATGALYNLFKTHDEVHTYLSRNETSDLHRDRFNELSSLANRIYLSSIAKGLTPREREGLMAKVHAAAANLRADFEQLYQDVLFQAENDPSGNRYGELLNSLESLEEQRGSAHAVYHELNSTYQDHVLKSLSRE